jgi:hypothetical protein
LIAAIHFALRLNQIIVSHSHTPTPLPIYKNKTKNKIIELHNDAEIPILRGAHPDRIRKMVSDGDIPIQVLALLIGCYLTFTITLYIDCINALVAQAITITLACSAYPQLSASAAVGALAGMTSLLDNNYGWLTLLIFITIVLWLFVFNKYKLLLGFGGRLGVCVFIAQNILELIMIAMSLIPSSTLNSTGSAYGSSSNLWSSSILYNRNENIIFIGMIFCSITINTVITGLITTTSKIPLNPIQVPTNVSLFVMLIFLSIPNLDDNHKQYIGESVATGAFLSMAGIEYLPTVYDFILAGFFSGLWSILFIPFFDGFAGKLGTMSFLGFCTYILLKKCILSFIPYCQENDNNDKEDDDDDDENKNNDR